MGVRGGRALVMQNSRKANMRSGSLLVVVLVLIVAAIGGCALFRHFPRTVDGPGHGMKAVSVTVDWNQLPGLAEYDKKPFSAGDVKFGGLELSKVYPVSEKGNAWNSRRVKLLFVGQGAHNDMPVRAWFESDVELKVVPDHKLCVAVSKIHKAKVSLFDEKEHSIRVATEKICEIFSMKAQQVRFVFRDRPGVAEQDFTAGDVWCRNEGFEFNVRTVEK